MSDEATLKQLNLIRFLISEIPDDNKQKKEIRHWLLFEENRTSLEAGIIISKLKGI